MCDRMPGPPPPKRLRISELNPHLLCALCGGYLIDATTIIECLHSFCKTCILRYLETSNYCPICEVLIHKTRPWQNIRLDHSLQNAVYKMVPGLFQNEMRRRREFYEKQNSQDKRGRTSSQPQGELGDRIIFSQDEEFSISIEFSPDGKPVKEVKENRTKSLKRPIGNCPPDKRYLKCPAGLRIEHLKKFIRSKFTLPQTVEIDLFYETEALSETFSLMDVAYIYSWKRDCVLRLFYSFYEIPSKLRKVETVTNVTEVSKSKINDNNQEKSDKRDNGKMTKGKKEKSREKRQSKLSGKRKVNSDGAASTSNGASNQDQDVAAEISKADSIVKCKEPDTECMSPSQNVKFFTTSTYKIDKHCSSSSVPERCSNKSHNIFQSPTKQKPPPETSYSVIAHLSNKEGKTPMGQDSKASLKMLIKSSDIKDCNSPNGETIHEWSDRKYESREVPSKAKIKKCQNGENQSILKSNLFEKMDTFARSSQADRKELTASSNSFSSPFQNMPNNYKRFKAADVKCDVKVSVAIAEPNTTIETIHALENLKPECGAYPESGRKQTVHSQATSLRIDEVPATKPAMCTDSSNNERVENSDVPAKDVAEMKPVEKDTTAASKTVVQSTPEVKKEVHVIKQEGCQIKSNEKRKANAGQLSEAQSIAHSSHNKAPVGFSYITQDTNQNETKVGHLEGERGPFSSKQNSSKQATCDTRMAVTESQQTIPSKLVNDSIQKREETKQNTSKQIPDNHQQKCGNQVADSSKQCSDDVNQTAAEVKSVLDICPTTSTKAYPDDPGTPISAPTLNSRVAKGTETNEESVTTMTSNRTEQQDYAVSKLVIGTAGHNGSSCYLRDQDSLKAVAVRVKAENKQQPQPVREQKQVSLPPGPVNHTPPSKPLTSNTTSKVASTAPHVRVHPSQVASSQAQLPTNGAQHATSNKQPVMPRAATTATTSFSTLPAPPKLLKTTAVTTTTSSSCRPTSYSIASIVSVPAVTTNSIPTSPVIGRSLAQSTSTTSVASSIAKVSRACEVISSMSTKTAPSSSCATTTTKVTLVMPLISAATTSSSTASLVSGTNDHCAISVKEKNADSSPASQLISQRKLPDTTSSPSDPPSRISTSACAPSKALPANTTAPTTAPSIALSITTPPIASSVASSTTATSSIATSVTATAADNWSSSTILNVANTFLHIPLTEKSALKETPAKNNAKATPVSSSNMLKQKEAIKLDNFLYDTKSVEMETAVRGHNVKDTCTVMKQGQKSLIRTKPNSSTQLHGLPMDKSSKNQGSHIMAIHNLPKTISQTSKPYSMARSMSVSSTSSSKCNIIQTTKISTLIPKSSSISSKAGSFSKSFSYPSTINNVPSSRSFLHTSLASHLSRSDMPVVINGSSGYERAMLTKATAFASSFSLQTSSPSSSTSHHRTSSSKHSSKDGDNKLEKSQKNKAIPPLTIPKSCLGTTLKLQRSPGSTDYIFAPLSQYAPSSHHNGERSKSKDSKHNGSRVPASPPTSTDDRMLIGERQRVPTIKISDINRNPIIVDSGASGNGSSAGNRHNPPYRSFSHGSSRSSSSENGSARTHSRGGSDSSSPTGSSDKSDRSPARDARRPSDSELLLSQHWHGYSAADLLFNGFKLPTHPKFHDLHYDTDAMPLDYSQSSSKS